MNFFRKQKNSKVTLWFCGRIWFVFGSWAGSCYIAISYNHIIVLCIVLLIWWQHRCLCDLHSFLQNSFTDIYLTNSKTHGIIIKLSHESESWGNLGIAGTVKRIGRSTGSGESCSRKVHLTKRLKCGRMNRLTVLDRLSRKRERECGMNFGS